MKARITNMKAPWPSGAVVGSIVLFAVGSIPVWAAGKCVPAKDGDEVDVTVPVPAESSEPVRLSEADQVREEARHFIERQRAEFGQHAQDMQAKLQALTGENESLGTALAESRSKVAELELSLAEVTAERDAARAEFVSGGTPAAGETKPKPKGK